MQGQPQQNNSSYSPRDTGLVKEREMKCMLNYYKGFEGEPEIRIAVKKMDNVVLSTWSSYFDEIMKSIKPVDGEWIGISKLYQLHEAWYDDGQYRVDDLDLMLHQLSSVATRNLSPESGEILNHLINIVIKARITGQDVFILYN